MADFSSKSNVSNSLERFRFQSDCVERDKDTVGEKALAFNSPRIVNYAA